MVHGMVLLEVGKKKTVEKNKYMWPTKMVKQKGAELTSAHELIKNTVHVEQSSLKTVWRLAESLVCN